MSRSYEVQLSPLAQRDRDQVIAYYDEEAPEQTDRFIDEFFKAARRLADFPNSAPIRRKDARQLNLSIFPYQIWYRVNNEAHLVQIIAVLHHRQDPAHVDKRLRDEASEK